MAPQRRRCIVTAEQAGVKKYVLKLGDEERERCRVEMQEALSELRSALERPLAPVAPETGTTLAAELAHHRR